MSCIICLMGFTRTDFFFYSQRRISTRGVDKGAKEDFKTAMRRQTARSHEAVDTLIIRFLSTERDLISESLNVKDFFRN